MALTNSLHNELLLPPGDRGRTVLDGVVHWLTQSRSHRVICMLVGLWIINVFDLVLTLLAHAQGMLDESNPIARRLLPMGPGALALFKLILVGGSSTVLLYNRRRLLAEVTSTAMFLVYACVAVRWQVCYELYALSLTANRGGPVEAQLLHDWAPLLML